MNNVNCLVVPKEIAKEIEILTIFSKALTDLPFEAIQRLKLKFCNFLSESDSIALLNKDGIICFSYHIDNQLSLSHQYLLSTSIFHLINSTVFIPSIDSKNKTPFTIFKSISNDNFKNPSYFNSSEKKLGYHNDLFIKNGKFYLPKYVSILNLHIGYEEGGNFYYINKSNWKSFNYFFENGISKLFSYEAPPLVYESDSKTFIDQKTNFNQIQVFWEEDKERYIFFNDSLITLNDPNFIMSLNTSLINNSTPVEINQKINQVILFRNDLGFHSRDVFKKPLSYEGIDRLFLRAVSEESILFPE